MRQKHALESAIMRPSDKALRIIKIDRYKEMIEERQTNSRCCPGDVPLIEVFIKDCKRQLPKRS